MPSRCAQPLSSLSLFLFLLDDSFNIDENEEDDIGRKLVHLRISVNVLFQFILIFAAE